jgi:hypothetical protein
MNRKPQPLYRKVNTRTRGVHHGAGGDFRHERNTKRNTQADDARGPMRGRDDRGLDYTPLFKFLLASVGKDWDVVLSEALARLDRKEPVFWMVAVGEAEKRDHVRLGDRSYFSGLFVDERNTLQRVAPELTVEKMVPSCACCTHTFNGVAFTRRWEGMG